MNDEDYIPFEGNLRSRVLSKEETERHITRLKKALEKRSEMTKEARSKI